MKGQKSKKEKKISVETARAPHFHRKKIFILDHWFTNIELDQHFVKAKI